MATSPMLCLSLLLISLTCCLLVSCDDRKVYIVYLGDPPKGEFPASSVHTKFLQETLGSDASESLVRSYHRSFHGFAAKLTEMEVQKLSGMEHIVSVFPNEKRQLHTTRSWDFMRFSKHVKRTTFESDIIIGMLDTGIWPESESFSDEGFGPPPKKWKGTCQESSNFTCNNKIIGARSYRSAKLKVGDTNSQRDVEGHGSHTSSIAAGNLVSEASLFGLGSGVARGGVPSARIAVYKICWADGCYDADILAAFDDAIADGVDIISISVGAFVNKDYFNDSIAIGAFHAMRNGILTSNSAGNEGPDPASVKNFSPWSLTVAASTIDRKFVAKVMLGNGKVYEGLSINTFDLENKNYPMIYGGDVPDTRNGFNRSQSRFCILNSLDKKKVKGKIVLCDELTSAVGAASAGAIGTVMQDGGIKDVAYIFPIPASYIGSDDGSDVGDYINSDRKPIATIQKSIEEQDELAPFVVSFSSRGPNPITSDILKPDITAPGVDILAAWTQATTLTRVEGDERVVAYNIISGTSMSCPHATAAAAYIKSFNPIWSPAAIKSALMTTASSMSTKNNPEAEFAYGAGQINPVKAVNPGLIYDAGETDFINFLCGQGYSTKLLRLVTGDNNNCSKANSATVWDLNYPSFALSAPSRKSVTRVFHRTVTNVGLSVSTYKAIVEAPSELQVQVKPSVLSFKYTGEKKSFAVSVRAKLDSSIISGSLVWDDGVHQVRSPIVAHSS